MRERTFLTTGGLNIVFQAGFLLFLWVVGRTAPIGWEGWRRTVALLILIGVPSAIWTIFFYLRDRRAPEPSRYVIAAFLGGMAAASVFAVPVERDIFRVDSWLYQSLPALALGSALVRGTLFAFLVYLLVRHGFVPSPEFDEPVDGLVYGAATGSGFATITSLSFLTAHPDFTLFAIGYTAAINILTYASAGGLVGYLVGRTKFLPRRGRGWHVLAIGVGLLVTGLYHAVNEMVLLSGWAQTFWLSFGLALLLSAVVLAVAVALTHRLGTAAVDETASSGPGDALVWICAIALLVAGGFVGRAVTRNVPFQSVEHGIAFDYPQWRMKAAPLVGVGVDGSPLAPTIFSAGGWEQGFFTFSVGARQEGVDLGTLDPWLYLRSGQPVGLAVEEIVVAGRRGLRARYAYVDPPTPDAGELPGIRWALTDIVPAKTRTFVFTLEGGPRNFGELLPVYRAILGSVRWTRE